MTNQTREIQNKTIQYIPPNGEYEVFRDQEHFKQKVKEWGLSSVKDEFWYKEREFQESVKIKGYEIYGNTNESNTIVIEFKNGNLTCIHPAYLKEMQQSSFGKENIWLEGNSPEGEASIDGDIQKTSANLQKSAIKKEKSKKEKAGKLELPVEKVHFCATVKQFAMTYNSFTEDNDEVIILEKVQIHQEPPIQIEYAWCSHSKTLKKWELEIGDNIEFDGKITAKKLAKGKEAPEEYSFDVTVPYKINNPSKIVK
jgi:hypothetical protein